MPAWLQYITDTGTPEQIARVAQFGVKVFGAETDMADPKAIADEGLRRFRSWLKSLGMPLTLKELGIPKADLEEVVKRCLAVWNGLVKGWVDLDEQAVRAIFTSIVE
jgi:alcohol dehydrogenase YqhD (iron-dependent ADH family)